MQAFIDSALQSAREYLSTSTGLAVAGIVVGIYVFAWCRVFAKAGYPSAWGLSMTLPPLWLVMPLVLAFGRWPVLREARELRKVQRAVHKADNRLNKAA